MMSHPDYICLIKDGQNIKRKTLRWDITPELQAISQTTNFASILSNDSIWILGVYALNIFGPLNLSDEYVHDNHLHNDEPVDWDHRCVDC